MAPTPSTRPPVATTSSTDPAVVQTIELEISESNMRALQDALPERIYVPATFRWNDVSVSNVGVRYKGNSSSNPDSPFKRSFLIKFAEYVDKQRFAGLRRVALDNAIQFGSLFSERMIGDILADVGVTISRSNYARIMLNGEFIGVYVNVERIDKSYLSRHFASNDGDLYKADEGGPGADLAYLGDDASVYRGLELKTNEDTSDGSALVALARDINTLYRCRVRSVVRDRVRRRRILAPHAGAAPVRRLRSIQRLGTAQFYLYHEPTEDRWTYLQWDLDVGFADNAFDMVPVIDNWDASMPGLEGYGPRPLLTRIVQNPDLLAAYRSYAADYLERYFEPELLNARLDALYDQIRDDLVLDPFPPRRATNPSDTDYDSIVASIKEFIQRRYDTATVELTAVGAL